LAPESSELAVMPTVAPGITAVFLDPAASWAGAIGADPAGTALRPVAAVTVQLLYDDTAAGVSHQETFEAVIDPLGAVIGPDSVHAVDHDARDFLAEDPGKRGFTTTDDALGTKAFWSGLQSGLKAHLVANQTAKVWRNTSLDLYSRVGEAEQQFRERCVEAAESAGDQALAKLRDTYGARLDSAKAQLSKAENRVADLEADAAAKQSDELLSGAGDLLGAFLGGRKRSNPLGQAAKRRAASHKAAAKVEAATEAVTTESQELADLEAELAEKIAAISNDSEHRASQIEEIEIPLEKTDIQIAEIKLVWVPSGSTGGRAPSRAAPGPLPKGADAPEG
jgi:hypothetical protein